MKSFVTSFDGLFSQTSTDTPDVRDVEIPMIQRDYAQGREGDAVARIRTAFLDVLHAAATGREPVSLDFVYGDVENGTLRPLDGQQRLTTLFLLHFYLASRANRMDEERGWKRFTYATRASARLFCQRLVTSALPLDMACPSEWIVDQDWYLYTWHHDPTIRSMLVMLDAIHTRFARDDATAAWERLVDKQTSAITFQLLAADQLGRSEDLYIKMNSRGKPLTPFESFKARFEQVLERSCPDRVDEFAHKIDGDWSDLLWPYHGGDFIVDDEFLRYFHFVTELSEWREGRAIELEITRAAENVYGPESPTAGQQLDFLFDALDTWVGEDVPAFFAEHFAAPATPDGASRVILFGASEPAQVNLFSACLRTYGQGRGRGRVFSLPHTLLLYAVLLHRLNETSDLVRRARVLRNLLEASRNELRGERMQAFLADVERVIVDGTLDELTALNKAQVADERRKADFLASHPELEGPLRRLEDHPALRGSLVAFELDAAVFAARAEAFHRLFETRDRWPAITGALLATGSYMRRTWAAGFRLGSGTALGPWREVLTSADRESAAELRDTLSRLLDEVTDAPDVDATLDAVQARWLAACEESGDLGWRYYLVKYACMREGESGIYAQDEPGATYRLCMLRRTRMSSNYRDPILLAIYRDGSIGKAAKDPWFSGYASKERWMELLKSGVAIRNVEAGFALRPPPGAEAAEVFARVCESRAVEGGLLAVPQVERDGRLVDADDRVQLAAGLLRDLVSVGL